MIVSRAQFIKKIKKQGKGKYTYEFGNRYPENKIGHQTCNQNGELVPKYMGWQWKTNDLGINKVRLRYYLENLNIFKSTINYI